MSPLIFKKEYQPIQNITQVINRCYRKNIRCAEILSLNDAFLNHKYEDRKHHNSYQVYTISLHVRPYSAYSVRRGRFYILNLLAPWKYRTLHKTDRRRLLIQSIELNYSLNLVYINIVLLLKIKNRNKISK